MGAEVSKSLLTLKDVKERSKEINPNIEIISKEDSMKIRSFKNFLKDEKLFKKIAHGIYEKQVF